MASKSGLNASDLEQLSHCKKLVDNLFAVLTEDAGTEDVDENIFLNVISKLRELKTRVCDELIDYIIEDHSDIFEIFIETSEDAFGHGEEVELSFYSDEGSENEDSDREDSEYSDDDNEGSDTEEYVFENEDSEDEVDSEGELDYEPVQQFYGIFVELTDRSELFCELFGDNNCLQKAVDLLNSEDCKSILLDEILSIVYNCCRKVFENRATCRPLEKVLSKLTKSKNEDIQALAFFTLAYVADKSDSDKFELSETCLKFMFSRLKQALREKKRISGGYSVAEITQGIRQLAINDNNKRMIMKIQEQNIFKRILLQHKSKEEVRFAAEAIWELAFIEENRQEFQKDKKLLRRMRIIKGKEGCEPSLHKAVSGALFQIEDVDKSKAISPRQNTKEHVMISYQHGSQNVTKEIKDFLEKQGYSVWMDTEKMKATYAFKLNKPIIPLMLEDDYQPSEWLDFLVAMKLYLKMASQEERDSYLPKLLKELGDKGKTL